MGKPASVYTISHGLMLAQAETPSLCPIAFAKKDDIISGKALICTQCVMAYAINACSVCKRVLLVSSRGGRVTC